MPWIRTIVCGSFEGSTAAMGASPVGCDPYRDPSGKREGPGGSGGPGPSRRLPLRALCGKHFVGRVVAVLLGVEPAPVVLPQLRRLRAQDAVRPRVAVRDDRAGDLVVALVAEARDAAIDRRGRVTALREPALRLVRRVRVVGVAVEQPAGVERVALRVQRVARVLDERDLVLRDEGDVVEAGVRRVALVEERERAGVRRRGLLAQLEDRA